MPRVLLREVYAGGVKGGRGQGDKGPGTKGPGKGGKGGRGRARWQGGEGGVPRRRDKANVGQGHKGAAQPSEPPAVRGGTGQGGAPRRAATRQSTPKGAVSCVVSCNEGRQGRGERA